MKRKQNKKIIDMTIRCAFYGLSKFIILLSIIFCLSACDSKSNQYPVKIKWNQLSINMPNLFIYKFSGGGSGSPPDPYTFHHTFLVKVRNGNAKPSTSSSSEYIQNEFSRVIASYLDGINIQIVDGIENYSTIDNFNQSDVTSITRFNISIIKYSNGDITGVIVMGVQESPDSTGSFIVWILNTGLLAN